MIWVGGYDQNEWNDSKVVNEFDAPFGQTCLKNVTKVIKF